MTEILHIINIGIEYAGFPKASVQGRQERINAIVRQSKAERIPIQFWEGVIQNKKPCKNISQAFKKVVSWAKEKKLLRVIIGEDDLLFTAPGAWQYYLDNMPKEFDLYLGGIYAGQIEENRIMNGYSGHTLLTVHERFYDFFLSANEEDHLDRWLGNFAFQKLYIVTDPFVVLQSGGFSDNKRSIQFYEEYQKSWKYYGM